MAQPDWASGQGFLQSLGPDPSGAFLQQGQLVPFGQGEELVFTGVCGLS